MLYTASMCPMCLCVSKKNDLFITRYLVENLTNSKMENSNLIALGGNEIRKIWHEEEWYFSIVDVIGILTDSPTPRVYWGVLKGREPQLFTICKQLKLMASDGRQRLTDCANTTSVLRIIMSVPSPKAEPLKMWLAEQGERTIAETENPELLTQRQIELYKAKGYPDEWIKERINSIDTRNKLTEEWQKRGVQEGKEYSILTAIIAKGTFDVTPSEHKDIKNLTKPSQNLRDHMTDLELIFMSLGEALTREETIKEDAQGFDENRISAVKGGKMAGKARETIEAQRGKKIVSSDNFLALNKAKDEKELPPNE
jgi:DNA-damage-inducible protein D